MLCELLRQSDSVFSKDWCPRDEIAVARTVVALPDERIKAGREHRVWLAGRALEITTWIKVKSGHARIWVKRLMCALLNGPC